MKPAKDIILLVNLGSPELLKTHAIRKFLRKFLSDRRVVNLPRIVWYPILFGIILPLRAPKLIKKYTQIWLEGISPLVHYTKLQSHKLAVALNDENTIVKYAFSYSTPLIADVLQDVHKHYKVNKLTVIPLYPQFSSTTTAAVFGAVAEYYRNELYIPALNFINDFYKNQLYIEALARSIGNSWRINGRSDKLIFSYHGLPQSLIDAGDVYFEQCVATTELVAAKLGLSADDYILAFQSRFGRQKWLLPNTSIVLGGMAAQGIKSVDIVCPGFVSDCLETLEEIAIMNKKLYLKAGGQVFNYIICLNDSDDFINILKNIVNNR